MASDKIIDRIRKLLTLSANNPEPMEAATALAQAQRMIHRHRVEQAQLDSPEEEEIGLYVDEPLASGPMIPPWKQAIASGISELNDCICLVSEMRDQGRDERIMVVAGRRVDFDAVALMYAWIVGIIEAAALRESVELARARLGAASMGRRWLNSFRHGAAAEVEARLLREGRAQRAQLVADPKTSAALAVRTEAVAEWMEEHIETRDANARAADVDLEAFDMGANVGRSLPLRGSHGTD